MPLLTRTTRFTGEYQQKLDASLRIRLTYFCIGLFTLGAVDLCRFLLVSAADDRSADQAFWIRLGAYVVALLIAAAYLPLRGQRLRGHDSLVGGATELLIILGTIVLVSRMMAARDDPNLIVWGLACVAVLYHLACVLLPWSPSESALPAAALLLVWGLCTFIVESPWDVFERLIFVIVSPVVLVPGLALSAARLKRRKERFEHAYLGRQVQSIGGELSRARAVHEALFPEPSDDGHVRFEYDYAPLREIGGDYIHAYVCRNTATFHACILDVAGHGLTAALTVTRLYGELERIRAEHPEATPGEVLMLMHRYVYLTMAKHELFATAACFSLDPNSGRLCWASAGHPPAFLRRRDGSVTDLPSTAMILGAQSLAEFDADEQCMELTPGDVLIAFTDGAYEACDTAGKPLGLSALRETARFTPPPRDWARFFAHTIATYHGGKVDDDVLITVLTFLGYRSAAPGVAARTAEPVITHIPQTMRARSD
ncbi:MAG: serine/threonine-protein phosphatase [Phycisphaerales bacterium]|nr:serine/threonine-protein phosphatase [Phycisphaerales bacterium]